MYEVKKLLHQILSDCHLGTFTRKKGLIQFEQALMPTQTRGQS